MDYPSTLQANLTSAAVPSEPFLSWFPNTKPTHHAIPSEASLMKSDVYHCSDSLRVGNGKGLVISLVIHVTIPSSKSFKLLNVLVVPGLSNLLLSVQ